MDVVVSHAEGIGIGTNTIWASKRDVLLGLSTSRRSAAGSLPFTATSTAISMSKGTAATST
jgi:hypothetical protein